MVNLINYLRLEGPCDEDCVPHANDENTSSLRDESTDEGEATDKGGDSKRGPIEEEDPEMELWRRRIPIRDLTRVERN